MVWFQIVPPILGAVADMHNSTAIAMSVPLGFFIVAWTYPLCVNFVDYYRIPADRLGEATIGVKNSGNDEEGVGGEPEKVGVEHAESGGVAMREVGKM